MSEIIVRVKAMAATITDLPALAPKQAPFTTWFELMRHRNKPFAFYVLDAGLPLVRAYEGFHEMRTEVVDAARIPGMYIEGLSLTAMGGEPYARWD